MADKTAIQWTDATRFVKSAARPNDVACVDCGHEVDGVGRRHEYDHFKGYAAEHHETVEVVCSSCHHKRERQRNG